MTREQLTKLFPRASESFIQANLGRVCPSQPERVTRVPLECVVPREKTGGHGALPCYRIRFDVWSVKPLDWDNHTIKQLQDLLVKSGILRNDDWKTIIEGTKAPHKANSKAEERTIVTIEEI